MTGPEGRWVKSLAGGLVKLAECRRCLATVAWATSKRTGKPYLCSVVKAQGVAGENGARRAVPWQPHRCDPEMVAAVETTRAAIAAQGGEVR